ncbi:MAG: LamG domain-containing protein, partial [Verrucomicrobia bacterium]|nr:LamG domain-containing protein [Verrucomicrobiota bacterium]
MRSTRSVPALRLVWLLAAARAFAGDADTVALWKFDAMDEKTYAIEDEKGGCDGVLVAQDIGSRENFLKPGLYGTAGLFDRGKWRVVVGHRETLSLRNDFSIECVIKPFDVQSFKTILWKGSRKVSPEAINYYLDIRDGKLEFKSKTRDGQWIVYATRKPVIEADRWHHLFLSFKDGHVVMAVNGVDCEIQPPADGVQAPGELVVNGHDLMIGDGTAASGQSNYSFDGLIDEVRIARGTTPSLDGRGKSDLYLRIVREQYAALEELNGTMRAAIAATAGGDATGPGVPEAWVDRLVLQSQALDRLRNESSEANARFMAALERAMAEAKYAALFGSNEPFAVTVLP